MRWGAHVPRTYYRDLIDLLKLGGCEFVRAGKGDHEIWYSPLTDKNFAVDRGCTRRHTAKKRVLKQAGLPKAF
jgi:hypothetical protein